jgi:hypothetical protein
MFDTPIDEQDCQQDTLRRLNGWLNALEGRIDALLSTNDFDPMTQVEREQAASRHLMITLRILQLRQQYAQASPSAGEQALLDALFHEKDED